MAAPAELDDDMPPPMPSLVAPAVARAAAHNGGDTFVESDLPPLMPSSVKINSSVSEEPGDENRASSVKCHSFSAFTMDSWAAGVSIYCIMYGVLPIPVHEAASQVDAMNMIREYRPQFRSDNRAVPDEAELLVRGLMATDVSIRLTSGSALNNISELVP